MIDPGHEICIVISATRSDAATYIRAEAYEKTQRAYPSKPLNTRWNGLTLEGLVTRTRTGPELGRLEARYYQPSWCVDLEQAKQMLDMLFEIERNIYHYRATEPGEVFMAFAAAIGAFMVAEEAFGSNSQADFAKRSWNWLELRSGRAAFERMIQRAKDQMQRPAAAA